MKVAAIYARVSTSSGQNVDSQLYELRKYCQRRKWNISREYVDIGISGARENRPELDKLLADAHRRKFDVVVVWKFDRFARNVSFLLRALETFKAQGIEFVSLSEQIDTSTPMGKMMFTILSSVAEMERSMIVERVRAGLKAARARGKKLGRPRKIANTDQINQLRAEGASWRAIGIVLGVSPSTAFCASTRPSSATKPAGLV